MLFAPPLEDFSSDLVGLSGVTVFLPLSLRYQFCLRIFFSSSTFLHHQSIQQSLALVRFPRVVPPRKKKFLLLSIPLTLAGCPWWRSLSPPALFLLSQIDAYTRGGAYRPPANLDPNLLRACCLFHSHHPPECLPERRVGCFLDLKLATSLRIHRFYAWHFFRSSRLCHNTKSTILLS